MPGFSEKLRDFNPDTSLNERIIKCEWCKKSYKGSESKTEYVPDWDGGFYTAKCPHCGKDNFPAALYNAQNADPVKLD